MATSYANLGGTGDRRRQIIVTISSAVFTHNCSILVDGSILGTGFFGSGAASGEWIEYDLGELYVVDEAKSYQSTTDSHGTWKWQGWDGGSWVDIGSSFTWGGATTQTETQLNGNTTAYTKYRRLGVSGSISGGPWLYETEFKLEFAGARANGCAYENSLGDGDRSATITVSSSVNVTTSSTLVDGTKTSGGNGLNAVPVTNDFIKWDFGVGKLIDEAALYWNFGHADAPFGTWKFQASDDNSVWTDLTSAFNLGHAANPPSPLEVFRELNGNTVTGRYLRMLCVTGSAGYGGGSIAMFEMEFRITDAPSSFLAAWAAGSNQLIGS
jgi:hypothetical protein